MPMKCLLVLFGRHQRSIRCIDKLSKPQPVEKMSPIVYPEMRGIVCMAGGLGAIGTQPDWPLLPIAEYNVTVIIANYRRFGV